jgi:hypothetical protein
LRAPQRLDTERSGTKSTLKSSRIAIAPSSASSRLCEPFLRRPRDPFERRARNLSNENVFELENSHRASRFSPRLEILTAPRAVRLLLRQRLRETPKPALDRGRATGAPRSRAGSAANEASRAIAPVTLAVRRSRRC